MQMDYSCSLSPICSAVHLSDGSFGYMEGSQILSRSLTFSMQSLLTSTKQLNHYTLNLELKEQLLI
jgi:hypothetical protein